MRIRTSDHTPVVAHMRLKIDPPRPASVSLALAQVLEEGGRAVNDNDEAIEAEAVVVEEEEDEEEQQKKHVSAVWTGIFGQSKKYEL